MIGRAGAGVNSLEVTYDGSRKLSDLHHEHPSTPHGYRDAPSSHGARHRGRDALTAPSHPRADRSDAALQPVVHLLQRVRQDVDPVPLDQMLARIDRLADLGTLLVDLSGGEPLLHPDADLLIARIRQRGMIGGTPDERISAARPTGLDG